MAETENLVLEHLRYIRADIDALRFDMADIKHRMATLEISVASLGTAEANHYASIASRADRRTSVWSGSKDGSI